MSNAHLSAVRELADLKGPARAILLILADHANESGKCWPSHTTIARECGLSDSTVKFHIKRLRDELGLISWTNRWNPKGDFTSNRYTLNLGGRPGDDPPTPGDDPPTPGDGPRVGRETAHGRPGDGEEAPLKPQREAPQEKPFALDGARSNPLAEKLKAKGTLEELKAFAVEIGLPASDGESMFDHWTANGWKNGSNPSKCWQAGIRKWKSQGWLPSQKSNPAPPPAGTRIIAGRAFKS